MRARTTRTSISVNPRARAQRGMSANMGTASIRVKHRPSRLLDISGVRMRVSRNSLGGDGIYGLGATFHDEPRAVRDDLRPIVALLAYWPDPAGAIPTRA